MAAILVLLREEASRTLLENGSTAAAALQVGELGFNNDAAALEFSYKRRNGAGFVRVPTLERLAMAAADASAGAKLVGYFPTSPLAATNVQDALDELAALAAGGGGGLGGTLTTGTLPKGAAGSTLADSILSEASSKIRFSGDTVANLYRSAAGTLATDGDFSVPTGSLNVGADLIGNQIVAAAYFTAGQSYNFDNSAINNTGMADIFASITKDNSNTRTFHGAKIFGLLNAGGSNLNTTLNLIEADTVNSGVTGVTVNLMKLAYGGSSKFRVDQAGDVVMGGSLYAANGGLFAGSAASISAPTANQYHNLVQATFAKNNSTTIEHHLAGLYATLAAGGSNANETLNLLRLDADTAGGTTGMTVNFLKCLTGGALKFHVDSTGYMKAITGQYGAQTSLAQTSTLQIGHMDAASNEHAALTFQYSVDQPPDPDNATQFRLYMRNDNIIFQYNDGGTTRYKYMPMSGTSTTWTHSTTPP